MSGSGLPPGIALRDPRPVAAEAPYTFQLPFPAELEALQPGDGVKAIFYQTEGETKYDAERMWVLIEQVAGNMVIGTLDSDPSDMPLIEAGMPVSIPLTHVISTAFHKDHGRPTLPERREYWDRCLVDSCVVDGLCHADYLYREEPDMTRDGDEFADSGWRIRGTDGGIAQDEERGSGPVYVALGVVLNSDDRWIHLIDSDVGSRFVWEPAKQDYVKLER